MDILCQDVIPLWRANPCTSGPSRQRANGLALHSAQLPRPLSISHCISMQPERRLLLQIPLPLCSVICLCRKHPLKSPFSPHRRLQLKMQPRRNSLAAKGLSREGGGHHLVQVSEKTISCKLREELLLLGSLWASRLLQAACLSPSVCMGETGGSSRTG